MPEDLIIRGWYSWARCCGCWNLCRTGNCDCCCGCGSCQARWGCCICSGWFCHGRCGCCCCCNSHERCDCWCCCCGWRGWYRSRRPSIIGLKNKYQKVTWDTDLDNCEEFLLHIRCRQLWKWLILLRWSGYPVHCTIKGTTLTNETKYQKVSIEGRNEKQNIKIRDRLLTLASAASAVWVCKYQANTKSQY